MGVRHFLFLAATALAAQTVEFSLLEQPEVQARLERAAEPTAVRHDRLRELFVLSGCSAERIAEQPVKHAKTPNIICTLPGSEPGVILVTAHYDMAGPGLGVIDNWTGATMLANLHAALAVKPRRHTIQFIGFTDEEKGLVGSRSFVAQAKREGLAPIRAVINVDSIGMGPASVWASRSDPRLLYALRQIEGAMKLGISWVNVDNVGDTDSHPFAEKKIPVIDFHSLTTETFPILHSARDTMGVLRFDDYYQTYRTLAAYLAFLDLTLEDTLAREVKVQGGK